MRDIKFRAWDKNLKQMYSHSELLKMTKDVVGIYKDLPTEPPSILLPVDQKHIRLMQYTGLKDRNGTEIYEGDILKDEENFLWVVDWCRGSFYIYNVHVITCEPLLFDIYEDIEEGFEVLGNIYENPELLEVEK